MLAFLCVVGVGAGGGWSSGEAGKLLVGDGGD